MSDSMDAGTPLKLAFIQLATAFRSPAVLYAALELDVFSWIPVEGAWSEAVARAIGVEHHRLRLLLNGLAAMGLLQQREGRFFIPPDYAPLLQRGGRSFADYLLAHKQETEDLLRLAATIRGENEDARFARLVHGSELVGEFLAYIEEVNRPQAERLLERLSRLIPDLQRVLSIGGAHGYYARRLLELNEAVSVTIADLEQAIAYSRSRHGDLSHHDRLELVVQDPLALAYEGEFDLVLLGEPLPYFAWDEKREIVRRGYQALRPGGTMVISKIRLDENGIEPASSALFSLKTLATTGSGYQETDAEAVALLGSAGAREVQLIRLSEQQSLITGVRS